ncbi:MAG TPA: hypothetical protein DCM05_07905 [Elusimicrobia bacterium]|nr:hypothetical protein [Elusimicrobiota bacterium]
MKYWVYANGEVPGAYPPEELAAMPGFAETSMVCPAEGGIENRNWRHAGEFQELTEALSARKRAAAAPPAPTDRVLPAPIGPEDILNDASSKIFLHVSDLMRELENRREERALTQALQRQIVELKNELLAARERIRHLEDRAALIPDFEVRERKLQESLAETRQQLEKLPLVEQALKTAHDEAEAERRRAEQTAGALERQKSVSAELSHELADKELTLARAFGIIRRLEETLGGIVPGAASGIAPRVPEAAAHLASASAPQEPPPPPPPPAESPRPEARTVEEISAALPLPEPAPLEEPAPAALPSAKGEPQRSEDGGPMAAAEEPIPPAPVPTAKDKIFAWLKSIIPLK